MWEETESVPIARVFTNLERRLARNTNDFEVNYYLARLHSMAYATNLVSVEVRTNDSLPTFYSPGSDAGVPQSVQPFLNPETQRAALGHLTNAIALYERAILLLKRSTNISERTWMILPVEMGLAWSLDQSGRTNDAIAMYHNAMRVAWKQEVTGDFDLKQWVNGAWDDVRAGRNPLHLRRGFIGPGVCYSEEIIGYLLKLLDPKKDAAEIARLKNDKKVLGSMGRAVTPIIVPLEEEAKFEDLVDENSRVAFDLDGSGRKRQWAWITPKAGWLVFDPNGTGRIDSALQMFGNVTFWIFWPDGYQALSALDDNGDGKLSGSELRGLAVWNDRNGDGLSEPGEVIPVDALGIVSISCNNQVHSAGIRWNPQGLIFTNGLSRATYDWIVPSREEE